MSVLSPLLLAVAVLGAPQHGDSLTLEAALSLARERSPALEAAEADVRRADAEVAAARAERGPRLGARLLYLRYQDPPELSLGPSAGFAPFLANNFAVLLQARQPLYTGGRVAAATRAAEAAREASGSWARQAAAELDAEVAHAFDDVLLARALVDVAAEGVSVLEEAVRVAHDQMAEGAVARIDVLRAETRLSSARTDERRARDRVADARERLAAVLGVEPATLPWVVGELVPPDADAVATLIPQGAEVDDGPALEALRAAARAHEAEADLARAALRPGLSLELGILGTRPELVTGRERWGQELFAGIGVSWTFFDFGRSSARRRASLSGAEGLRAAEDALVDSLAAAYRVRSREVERALGDVAEATANAARAADVLDLAQERYAEGIGIQLEVLEAEADLVRVRGELQRAIHASRAAEVELRRILGRPAMEYAPSAGGWDR